MFIIYHNVNYLDKPALFELVPFHRTKLLYFSVLQKNFHLPVNSLLAKDVNSPDIYYLNNVRDEESTIETYNSQAKS